MLNCLIVLFILEFETFFRLNCLFIVEFETFVRLNCLIVLFIVEFETFVMLNCLTVLFILEFETFLRLNCPFCCGIRMIQKANVHFMHCYKKVLLNVCKFVEEKNYFVSCVGYAER